MRHKLAGFLAFLVFLSGIRLARAGSITFFDGTFADSDWQLTVFTNGGNATATQVPSGGDPGAYRQITNTVADAPNPNIEAQVIGFHGNLNALYNPQAMGAITSINYSEDAILLLGDGQGQGASLALLQNGNVYQGPYHITPNTAWTNLEDLGVVASDFGEIVPALIGIPGKSGVDPTQHPDFSANGSLIEFGFIRSNSTEVGGPGYTTIGGIDNWTVTVNSAVPEPCTLTLLGIAAASLLLGCCWPRGKAAA
jgi:hypothetical protein